MIVLINCLINPIRVSENWPSGGFTKQLSDRVAEFVNTPYAESLGFISSQQVISTAIRHFLSNLSHFTSFLEISDISENIVFINDFKTDLVVMVNVVGKMTCLHDNSNKCDHVKFTAILPKFSRYEVHHSKINKIKNKISLPKESTGNQHTTKKIPIHLYENVVQFLKTNTSKNLGFNSITSVFISAVNVFLDELNDFTVFFHILDIVNNKQVLLYDQMNDKTVIVKNLTGIISCSLCHKEKCEHVEFCLSYVPRFYKTSRTTERISLYSAHEINTIVKTIKTIVNSLDVNNYAEILAILQTRYHKEMGDAIHEPSILVRAIMSIFGKTSKTVISDISQSLENETMNVKEFVKKLQEIHFFLDHHA